MTIEQEARAEAEMRLDENAWMFRGRDAESGWFLNGFIKGAEWAASRPVTDAEIEKARVAYVEAWEAERKRIGRGIAPKGTKSRAGMRAALEAIRPTEGNPT